MPGRDGFGTPAQTSWDRERLSHFALNTTVRCQHRCVYCFEGAREGKRDVGPEETKRLIDQAEGQVPAVIFMGAEPTLNSALPELIAYARGRGLRVRLSTNALRLADWDYLCRLHDAGLGVVEFSFPYPDAEVYGRITGAKPDGFRRILAAIENLARMDRERPQDEAHTISAVVPVSRYNVDRLDEVVAHLLAASSGAVVNLKLKCLDLGGHLSYAQIRDLYVPCAVLRRALPAFAARLPGSFRLAVDDFPLCATPGLEALGHDWGYWMNDVVFRHNFVCQDRLEENFYHLSLPRPEPFDWICEQCLLSPVCLSRGLFRHALPEQPPVPVLREIPERVRAAVLAQSKGDAAWKRVPRETIHGWLLRHLLQAVPLDEPLGATGIRWEPLRRGEIRLSRGAEAARFQLSSGRDRSGQPFVGLVPAPGTSDSAWAKPGLALLRAALRALPPPPAALLPGTGSP